MEVPTFESGASLQQLTVPKYTMPKQTRFNGNYQKPLCDNIYEIPDAKNSKSTGMGFGNRRDIINRKETENMPSPLNYNPSSVFEENFYHKKGYSLSQKLKYKVNK